MKNQTRKRTRTKMEDQGEKPSVSQVVDQDWCQAVNQDEEPSVDQGEEPSMSQVVDPVS